MKEQIRADIVEELESLGFATADSDKKLSISILDWNFDGYQNGKFWYGIKVAVIDGAGNVLATETLKDEVVIKGSVMSGAKTVPYYRRCGPNSLYPIYMSTRDGTGTSWCRLFL